MKNAQKPKKRPFNTAMILALSVCLLSTSTAIAQEGMLPSLDHHPGNTESGITPVSALKNLETTEKDISTATAKPVTEAVKTPEIPLRGPTALPTETKPSPAAAQTVKPSKQVTLPSTTKEQPQKTATHGLIRLQPAKSNQRQASKPLVMPGQAAGDTTASNNSSKAKTPDASSKPQQTAANNTNTKLPAMNLETPIDGIPEKGETVPSETPAVHRPGFLEAIGFSKGTQPVSYSPLSAIAIFPVIKHKQEKAFGDLPLVFAREYAQRMELKAPDTRIYHPIYTVDELRIRGLGHVYDQIMDYYLKAGRPEPAALDYLLKQFAGNGQPIARVIFVEADLDMTHPDASTGPLERVFQILTDGMPKQMKYFVHSRLQVFDADDPSFPMVWGGSWSRAIKTNQFYNVTPSVFTDSDSQRSFAGLSRQMSRELLMITPREVYMEPQYDASVQGKLVSGKTPAFPDYSKVRKPAHSLSDENKQAIQRILQRQNGISP
jgi:hypothetical protein